MSKALEDVVTYWKASPHHVGSTFDQAIDKKFADLAPTVRVAKCLLAFAAFQAFWAGAGTIWLYFSAERNGMPLWGMVVWVLGMVVWMILNYLAYLSLNRLRHTCIAAALVAVTAAQEAELL
jgi:hypothetical protein